MSDVTSEQDNVKILDTKVLANDWGKLTKYIYEYRRSDGAVQILTRETYDRGHGAVLLLYNRTLGTVVLTRQFRLPAYVTGHREDLIEVCAGLLDERDPEEAIRHEAEEETGYRVTHIKPVWHAYMSPGSVTERLHFYVAEYAASSRAGTGGGVYADGEDITVMEMSLEAALQAVDRGEIIDAKTIMLLQHAELKGLCRPA